MEGFQLQEIHDRLVKVAHRAGEMMLATRPSSINCSWRTSTSVHSVTEIDTDIEAYVLLELRGNYPDFKFIGEETYEAGKHALTAEPTFIVDPVDGTMNFIHGVPYVCVSLGLAVNRTPTIGVVYNPFLGQLYTAIRGQGSYLTTTFPGHPTSEPITRQKLPLKQPEKLTGVQGALIGVEWGTGRAGNDFLVKSKTMARLTQASNDGGAMCHGLRSFGSAALHFCEVAVGRMDVYWEAGCWAWDACAAWAILIEAGGVMVGANPGETKIPIDGRRYLAVRGDDEDKIEEGGVMLSQTQLDFVKEFWGYVEGIYEVGN